MPPALQDEAFFRLTGRLAQMVSGPSVPVNASPATRVPGAGVGPLTTGVVIAGMGSCAVVCSSDLT